MTSIAGQLLDSIAAALALDFSPRLPPWSLLRRDTSVVGRIRRAATRSGPMAGSSAIKRVILNGFAIYWQLRATLDAVVGVIRFGGHVQAASGTGRLRQLRESLWLAHRLNYSPRTYYAFRFWDESIRDRCQTFLQVHELGALQQSWTDWKTIETTADKEVFDTRCRKAAIPTPTVVLVIKGADEEWADGSSGLPACDLFLKPLAGEKGAGAERWTYDRTQDRWSRQGATITRDALLAHVRGLARVQPMLVQQCLENHPDVARFSAGPLCTFRVMTYRDGDGRLRLLAVSLKMARAGSDVDNLQAGGMVSAVDPVSGRLTAAIGRNPTLPPCRQHPDTLETIEGAVLTTHGDAVALALRAHDALPVAWSIGWDVAMTPTGPVMIEGNAGWGIGLFHVPHRTGVPPDFSNELLRRIGS